MRTPPAGELPLSAKIILKTAGRTYKKPGRPGTRLGEGQPVGGLSRRVPSRSRKRLPLRANDARCG